MQNRNNCYNSILQILKGFVKLKFQKTMPEPFFDTAIKFNTRVSREYGKRFCRNIVAPVRDFWLAFALNIE